MSEWGKALELADWIAARDRETAARIKVVDEQFYTAIGERDALREEHKRLGAHLDLFQVNLAAVSEENAVRQDRIMELREEVDTLERRGLDLIVERDKAQDKFTALAGACEKALSKIEQALYGIHNPGAELRALMDAEEILRPAVRAAREE